MRRRASQREPGEGYLSLILTHIDGRGIVHAADSNLSSGSGKAAGTGRKVFTIPYLKAGLSLAGSYAVNGVPMNRWMPRMITAYGRSSSPTLADFAERLRSKLEQNMTTSEKKGGCLVHLAGHVRDPAGDHPEFYFIRNITALDPNTGAYLGAGQHFTASEDFWTRDFAAPANRAALAAGSGVQLYINGFPSGRIVYLGLMKHMGAFLKSVWSTPGWLFRPPKTLDEVAVLLELQLGAIGAMFRISDYTAPFIGGPVQILCIAP